LFLGIFVLPVLHKKMHGVFLEGRTSASYRILVLYFQRKLVEVLQLPRLHMCRGIVCDMLHVPTPFEDKSLQSFFRELFCCPTAADARADNYNVERTVFYTVYIQVCHDQSFFTGK